MGGGFKPQHNRRNRKYRVKLGYYTRPSDATLARMYPFVPPGVNVQDWRRNLHHANILERGGTFTQLDPQISDKSLLDDFEVNQAIARTQKRLDDTRLSAAQRHIDRENKLFEDKLKREALPDEMHWQATQDYIPQRRIGSLLA